MMWFESDGPVCQSIGVKDGLGQDLKPLNPRLGCGVIHNPFYRVKVKLTIKKRAALVTHADKTDGAGGEFTDDDEEIRSGRRPSCIYIYLVMTEAVDPVLTGAAVYVKMEVKGLIMSWGRL
ncbi:hypothetical protein V8G54_036688 [Vigna mungo]|uniref:Uncharacterized protein n=1 Tax=Vigna mungo TaxID=3915 RepID=A0AAQ3MHP3_VIGMU